jgi:hypothetical protein
VPSRGGDSVRVRVHLYERRFRRKTDRRVLVDEVVAGVTHSTGSALHNVMDEARLCRRTATCIWGGSDPPFSGRRTSTGGWQRGSLTPQMPASLLLTAAPTATRAAKSAARLTAVKSHNGKDIAEATALVLTFNGIAFRRLSSVPQRGPLLPRVWSPSVSSLSSIQPAPRGGRTRVEKT